MITTENTITHSGVQSQEGMKPKSPADPLGSEPDIVTKEGGKGGESDPRSGADSLPCLYSNNTAQNFKIYKKANGSRTLFSPYNKKQAQAIYLNTARFLKVYGLDNVGFLTLTFPDHVTDPKEAYRRFCSMRKHHLSKYFGDWMMVKERTIKGRWHYHLLVDCKVKIRTPGFNWEEVAPPRGVKAKYGSACPALRNLWRINREGMPKYGFGRAELLPIRSNAEAMARYVGKYLSKHVEGKTFSGNYFNDKGVRMFSASSGFTRSSTKFSWNTEGAKEWRRKLKDFTLLVEGLEKMEDLKEKYGPKWAYHLGKEIYDVDDHLAARSLSDDEKKKAYLKAKKESSHPLQKESPLSSHPGPQYVVDSGVLIDRATGQVLF